MSITMMRAVRVHEFGGPDVLSVEEIQRPQPQAGEALVRVHYAGVLPFDWKMRYGSLHQAYPVKFPYVPGVAVSGTIETVGTDVTNFQVGQAVFGKARGSYAEFAIVPVEELVPMPDNLAYEDAAAITGGAAAAWKALFNEGELQTGQRVLIHAAAGGVGQFAVQLAKWKGAEVIGTASTANIEFVRTLGADQVIDYTQSSFEEIVKDVDLVIDAIGGETQARSWSIIKRGGTLVSLVQPPSIEKARELGIQAKFNTTVPTNQNLQTLAQLIADGTIKAEIENIFTLNEVKEAHKRSETGRARGRILLKINPS